MKRPKPVVVGAVLLALVQGLHFGNVAGWDNVATAFARENITPLAWLAYVMLLAGILTRMDGVSYVRRYRNRLAVCWLFSVPAWCYFDWMNFYFMRDPRTGLRAWEYVNLPPDFVDRLLGYLLAFGAIAPGMFLTAEVLQRLGLYKIGQSGKFELRNGKRPSMLLPTFIIGILLTPIPILIGTPASNLAIWVGMWALLDPINCLCERPSILRDWHEGRFGRTLALGAAGLICGFLWEFWNFWATTKWVYHLPFLGGLERYKYFEMPVMGLIGFVAFGIETWTMWQTALLIFARFVEGERGERRDQGLYQLGCL